MEVSRNSLIRRARRLLAAMSGVTKRTFKNILRVIKALYKLIVKLIFVAVDVFAWGISMFLMLLGTLGLGVAAFIHVLAPDRAVGMFTGFVSGGIITGAGLALCVYSMIRQHFNISFNKTTDNKDGQVEETGTLVDLSQDIEEVILIDDVKLEASICENE